jgi:hypothetical protein
VSYQFQLRGAYRAVLENETDGVPLVGADLDLRLGLSKRHADDLVLSADGWTPVAFGGISLARVVVLRWQAAVGGDVRITSADGVQQVVPLSDYLLLTCRDVPVTAVDVRRSPGVPTVVKLFLGE